MVEIPDFDFVNLAEIDPQEEKLPDGVYRLKILNAEIRSGTSASGKAWQCVQMRFAVENHPQFAGRRLTERFFKNEYALKHLRRIMDATGVQQQPGQTLSDWLKQLAIVQPSINVNIVQEPEKDPVTGEPLTSTRNRIQWFNVWPAE